MPGTRPGMTKLFALVDRCRVNHGDWVGGREGLLQALLQLTLEFAADSFLLRARHFLFSFGLLAGLLRTRFGSFRHWSNSHKITNRAGSGAQKYTTRLRRRG